MNDLPVTESYVYDLHLDDLIGKMKELYRQKFSDPKDLKERLLSLEEVKRLFLSEMKGEGNGKISDIVDYNPTVPSSYRLYHVYLSYKLLTCDPYRIGLILNHHAAGFAGNEQADRENFAGLLEFYVYTFVKSHLGCEDNFRLEKITNWLEDYRSQTRVKQKKVTDGTPDSNDKDSMRVRIKPDLVNELADALGLFIETHQKNDFIDALVQDEYVKSKIKFKAGLIVLVYLFKILKNEGRLTVKNHVVLADWLCERFEYERKESAMKGSVPINKKVALHYLNSSERGPKQKNKKLIDSVLESVFVHI